MKTDRQLLMLLLGKMVPNCDTNYYDTVTPTEVTIIGENSQTMTFEFDIDGNFLGWR